MFARLNVCLSDDKAAVTTTLSRDCGVRRRRHGLASGGYTTLCGSAHSNRKYRQELQQPPMDALQLAACGRRPMSA